MDIDNNGAYSQVPGGHEFRTNMWNDLGPGVGPESNMLEKAAGRHIIQDLGGEVPSWEISSRKFPPRRREIDANVQGLS